MIAGHAYPLTLAYCEVSSLEEYLENLDHSLERMTNGASFSASAHGITITFPREEDRAAVWDLVLEATNDGEDE